MDAYNYKSPTEKKKETEELVESIKRGESIVRKDKVPAGKEIHFEPPKFNFNFVFDIIEFWFNLFLRILFFGGIVLSSYYIISTIMGNTFWRMAREMGLPEINGLNFIILAMSFWIAIILTDKRRWGF